MNDEEPRDVSNALSVSDMRSWGAQEVKDAIKALELRRKEITALVDAYAAGEISAQRADELQSRYYHRWGEALPGVSATPTATDEQILAAMDRSAERGVGPFIAPAETHAKYTERFQRRNRGQSRD